MSEATVSGLPQDAVDLLNDSRLEGMTDALHNFPRTQRVLEAVNPPVAGESPYVLLRLLPEDDFAKVDWLNEPTDAFVTLDAGRGNGFGVLSQTPHLLERRRKPGVTSDAWKYVSWMVASEAFASLLRKFDPSVVQTIPIDWHFSDGKKLDGYTFLDVTRLVDAYDYKRTNVTVEMHNGLKSIVWLGNPRALKHTIDRQLHLFRDVFRRGDIFLSRELGKAIAQAKLRGVDCIDPATGSEVEFK
jgi:hypothetical protein